MIFKLLYLRYYFFLKKCFPSALGIEEAASSFIIGFFASLNIIMAYFFICKNIIRICFFNDYILIVGHLSIMFFTYYYFKNFHFKQFRNNKAIKVKALTLKYTLLGILYPMFSLLFSYLIFSNL